MAKFRKKPVVIEAVLWDGSLGALDQIAELGGSNVVDVIIPGGDKLSIATLEGTMIASSGDWIIKGVKGEFYPCKADIFAATYEAAE